MKPIKSAIIFALLSLLAAHITVASPESDAAAVLTRYFDALTQGDVLTLRSLMAGELLKKRSRLLDNPTYPAFLINTYGNARFQIDTVKSIGQSALTINASIIYDQDNISQRQYLLRDDSSSGISSAFRIYDDRSPDVQ
jgi:hypothetical protein